MFLEHLTLQNFRNYTKRSFEFFPTTTLIVGPNTSGKTNILEAIALLSLGKSMRGHRAGDLVRTGQETGFVKGVFDGTILEVILTVGRVFGGSVQSKKLIVNGVSRRSVDFVGNLKTALFEPEDLELVHASPDKRRAFLDDVLIQVDRAYRQSLSLYERALKQRNRMLKRIKEEGRDYDLEYWDGLLIAHGEVITRARDNFIDFLNNQPKNLGEFTVEYDKSVVNEERLSSYFEAERNAGVTLVGPQRDDFILFKEDRKSLEVFGSRGEQRMAVLWLKIGELAFLEKVSQESPLLLLDDILSELDEEHIREVSEVIGGQQTILTTTHKELVPKSLLRNTNVIEL